MFIKLGIVTVALGVLLFGSFTKLTGSEQNNQPPAVMVQVDAGGVRLVNNTDHLLLVNYQIGGENQQSGGDVRMQALDSKETYRTGSAASANDVKILSIDTLQ